jgi:hypothetical protein
MRRNITEDALQKQRGAKRHNGEPLCPDPEAFASTLGAT